MNELICRTEIDSQTSKNLWLPKGGRGGLGIGDGNVLKLGFDDGCTTINIIFKKRNCGEFPLWHSGNKSD